MTEQRYKTNSFIRQDLFPYDSVKLRASGIVAKAPQSFDTILDSTLESFILSMLRILSDALDSSMVL